MRLVVTDNAGRKAVKKSELNKFEAALFLRNANHDRYGDLLIEYRKAYANKECRYPKSMHDMMDVMRQQPDGEKNPANPTPDTSLNDNDEDLGESSFAHIEGA